MDQARRRAAGEERVFRGVPPARRRRKAERVRHELGAVVEREARVSCEIPGKICGEFALVRAARRARRRESRLRHAQEVRHSATKYPSIGVLQPWRIRALS